MSKTKPKAKLAIKIKRFDQELPLPQYQTAGAVGLDLVARTELIIAPQTVGLVPLNIALALPTGYFAQLVARSSLQKRGLWLANGVGVIDTDYCGDEDEIRAPLFNFSSVSVTVTRGERLAQLLILSTPSIEWREVERLGGSSRGGFGSTGA